MKGSEPQTDRCDRCDKEWPVDKLTHARVRSTSRTSVSHMWICVECAKKAELNTARRNEVGR